MQSKSYTIVGTGLAGVNIAWHLYKKGISFDLYDNENRSTSNAAAGLVNPIVFRRLNKSWLASDLIPYATKFYTEINQKLQKTVWRLIPIKKVLLDLENVNDWGTRLIDTDFDPFFGEIETTVDTAIKAPFGLGKVEKSGVLNVREFVDESLNFFKEKGIIIFKEQFNSKNIAIESQVIFAEGSHMRNNPFFSYLPLYGTHGETILIKSKNLNIDFVLNKNMFIVPLGEDIYKVGATYNWELEEPIITEKAKKELVDKLKSFTNFDFEIIDHIAGIRPTVKDRRPLIGRHPVHHNLYVFNGMGPKGAMQSPYFAEHFVQFLEGKVDLSPDINITRYEDLVNE